MKTQNLPAEYLIGLGLRLKVIRTFLKLDQRQMSKLMKTGQSQISKIESGRSAPTLSQLIRIKRLSEENDYLRENLSWEWILEGKGKGIIG
jgi:transcriptional regulator with XRE-family HTH domain